MKNILITGGAGFIGSNLAIRLIELGYNVTVLDNLSPQIHGDHPESTSSLYKSIKDKVNFIQGSVTSKSDWLASLKNQDAVIHLAAETGTGQSMYEIVKYCNVNIIGTALLLDILTNLDHSVKKIIVASSRAIYGEGKYYSETSGFVYPKHRSQDDMVKGVFEVLHNDEPVKICATDEASKIHPSSIYGVTKQAQEQMVLMVCEAIGIAGVAFRYQNVYGPGQALSNPYTGILSIFSNRILNNQDINIFEDGLESRDFVYIDDVVEATILGLESTKAKNKIYNVGTGQKTTVLEVVGLLMENYGSEVPLNVSGDFRIGDIRHNYADLNKITKDLGFSPNVDFMTGIKKFCQWVAEQPRTEDKYDKSLDEMRGKGLLK